MKVIAGARRSGRTTELIKLAAAAEAKREVSYIVCHSQQEASRIARLAQELELFIGFPITYNELLKGEYAEENISNLFIDNVELLLPRLATVNIAAVAITTDEVVLT